MKPIAAISFLLTLAIAVDAFAQDALTIESDTVTGISTARIGVTMDNLTDSVEGFVLASEDLLLSTDRHRVITPSQGQAFLT